MVLPLATALLAIAAAQVPTEDEPRTGPEPRTFGSQAPAGSPEAARPGAVEIDGAGQSGIPFVPSVSSGAPADAGTTLLVAVASLLRTQTIGGAGESPVWGTDVEVNPGIGVRSRSATLGVDAAYAVRLTIPVDAVGSELAVLQRAFVRLDWRIDPIWTLSLDGAGTYGQYSQLVPVATPGGPGSPPPSLNPVRSFSTYPYLSLSGGATVATQLSTRTRLRVTGSYVDVGGIGDEGAAAQPRTWGPVAGATFEWDLTAEDLLSTTAGYQNSILVEGLALQVGTVTEGWRHRWTRDLETLVSAGAAVTSADSATFLTFGHVLPVASIGIGFHTDVRHTLRLGLDFALAPYVDTYLRTTYQRATGRLGLDWAPDPSVSISAYVAAALVPYSVGAPDAFGTAGASVGWAPLRVLTLSLGGFTQAQFQENRSTTGTYQQWSFYFSIGLQDSL